MERQLYLMRVTPDLIPAPGGATRLALPDTVSAELDAQGWRVVSHQVATIDLDGTLLLTLYVERDAT